MLVESIIEVALLLARLALAVVFCMAGVAKLADLPGTRSALRDFGVNSMLAVPLAVALPVFELAVAGGLLPVMSARWAAGLSAAMLVVFMAAMLWNMAQGRRPDCGCFGQTWPDPVGWKTLARNASLFLMSIFVALDPGASLSAPLVELSATQAAGFAFAAALLGLVILQGWFIFRLLRQNGRLMLCIDSLEQHYEEGAPPVWYAPSESLPVGSPAPGFRLPDLAGNLVNLDDLRRLGPPVLLIFVNPTCQSCRALLPEAAAWQRRLSSDLTVVLISQGSPKDNQRMLDGKELDHFLIQRGRELAEAYQVYGTPSAVLVGRQGELLSAVAAGSVSIRRLVTDQVVEPIRSGFPR